MASETPNITKIIKKLLSDPRVVGAVTQVLSEILSEKSNIAEKDVATTPVQPTQIRKRKQTTFASKSKSALRTLYAYRRKKGITIEPELNAELAKRFPGYDATQQKFTRNVAHTPKQINWAESSNDSLRSVHAYRRKKGITIEPELNAELATRFPGYDPTQQKFMGRIKKDKKPKVRIINWAEKSNDILRKAYQQRIKTPAGIDDELNAELTRRFPTEYDGQTRKFVPQKKIHNFTTKDTQKSTVTPSTQRQSNTTVTVTKEQPVTKPVTLSVTIKLVKQSLDTTYNNVYINGKLLLRNHANTELKLFADGTLLGIRGIVTNDKNLPTRPLWLVYNTDLVQNKWAGQDKFSGYSVYAKNIRLSPTGVYLELSNRVTVLLDTEKLKRLAGLTRFEIKR